MADNHFNGKGFSQEPLTPEETAEHRHFINEARETWQTVIGMDQLNKGAKALGKIIGGAAVLGAGVAWLINMGIFG